MKAYLTRRYWFSASHRLHNDALSADENWATYGKCNNPHGHGHNYALEVTVAGTVDPRTGMVFDLVELDTIVQREVLDRFGHENLNLLPDFKAIVPTSENLTECIFNILQPEILKRTFHATHLEKVRLDETAQNVFEYAGGAELRH
jgi:6-pyruvoyltetrahydropterin/6-carboxytetrahydropterin synthase